MKLLIIPCQVLKSWWFLSLLPYSSRIVGTIRSTCNLLSIIQIYSCFCFFPETINMKFKDRAIKNSNLRPFILSINLLHLDQHVHNYSCLFVSIRGLFSLPNFYNVSISKFYIGKVPFQYSWCK